jgi:hypothetical protein
MAIIYLMLDRNEMSNREEIIFAFKFVLSMDILYGASVTCV